MFRSSALVVALASLAASFAAAQVKRGEKYSSAICCGEAIVVGRVGVNNCVVVDTKMTLGSSVGGGGGGLPFVVRGKVFHTLDKSSRIVARDIELLGRC